jgi:hypothetical protein
MHEDKHQCTQDTETLKLVKQICAEVPGMLHVQYITTTKNNKNIAEKH